MPHQMTEGSDRLVMRLMEPCLGVVVIVEREIYGHCECESRKELMIRALSQVYEAVASQLN